ncbi:MAG: hypothetical protein GWP91_07430 [Rhodobacterales bacterium]|nr:hypothetical protein [Rhodobacterales bacterium]
MKKLLFMMGACSIAGSAYAQCEGDWNNARVLQTLDEADASLDNADIPATQKLLRAIASGFPCLEELAQKPTLGRFGRTMALMSFFEQDEIGAARWGTMAMVTDPEGEWPVPEGHPLMDIIAEAEEPVMGRASGGLIVPDKGAVFMNGTLSLVPEGLSEVPYLVQIFDKNGFPGDNFWQDGAAFNERLIDPEGDDLTPPKWYDAESKPLSASDEREPFKAEKPPKVKKDREPFPILPIAISGGLGATSAVTYMLASGANASLVDATTSAGLTKSRSTANSMVMISGLTFAGAIGVGIGGVMVSTTGNGFLFSGRF